MISSSRQERPGTLSGKRCKCLASTLKDAFSNCHALHEESSSEPSKRCKIIASSFRDAFSDCRTFRGKLSSSSPEEDLDFGDEEEFVSEVISKYMESKTKTLTVDSLSWALSPETRKLFVTPMAMQEKSNDDEAMDDFFSAGSQLSRCSSVTSIEPFASAKTTFSRSSSLSRTDFENLQRRRVIIQELSHCRGWPFGLCKKVLLLPPLPKTPSDSWLWCKSTSAIRTR